MRKSKLAGIQDPERMGREGQRKDDEIWRASGKKACNEASYDKKEDEA